MLGPRGSGACLVVALALLLVSSPAAAVPPEIATTPDPDTSITPYAVHAVATNGYRTALGGAFNWVGPRAHGGGVVSPTSGALLRAPHGLPERVEAVEPDGAGGWYVGGFGRVVHVLPDGEVDEGFAVTLVMGEAEGQTRALALSPDGRTLWVGGRFGTVNGALRQSVAAVDADTGALREWRSTVTVEVWDLAVDPGGGTVYVSGRVSVQQQPDGATVAALDAATGDVRATGPRGLGEDVEVAPDGGTVYVTEYCNSVACAGEPTAINALSAPSLAPRWRTPGSASSLVVDPAGGSLYASGGFGGGTVRIRAADGALDQGWRSYALTTVHAVSPDGAVLYGTGKPSSPIPEQRQAIAVATSDGAVLPWAPGWIGTSVVDDIAISRDGHEVFVGGWFDSLSGRLRTGMALLDETGAPSWWTAADMGYTFDVTEIVDVAIADDGTVYVARYHESPTYPWAGVTAIAPDGSSRWHQQLSGGTPGELLLSPDGRTLYLGGAFTAVGDVPRQRLAALRAEDGTVLPWAPVIGNGGVGALALSPDGATVYAGGSFTAPRLRLAAFDAASGALRDFAPAPDDYVHTVAASADGDELYVGGLFDHIGSQDRSQLAAVRVATGAATGWNPSPDRVVKTLALSPDGSLLVAGGSFTMLGAAPGHSYIAAFDTATGAVADWRPQAVRAYTTAYQREVVDDLAFSPDGRKLHVAGSFHLWGDALQRNEHYARFSIAPDEPLSAPASVAAPFLAGTVRARSWVTCDPGWWRNHPDRYTYAWTLDGAPIAGADGRDLRLADAYADHRVGCRVTAEAATAESGEVVVAAAPPPASHEGSSTPGDGSSASVTSSGASAGGSLPPADTATDVTAPRLRVARAVTRVRRPTAVVVRLTLSEPSRVQVGWRACDGCRWRSRGMHLDSGRHRLTLRALTGRRRPPDGRYTLRLRARDAAGNRSRRATLTVVYTRR